MNDLYLNQPREVSIETLALCNARCEFCPYDTLDRKGVKMSDEMLWRLLDQMREWSMPFHISPFKVNEPFLDKRLLPLCRDIIDTIPQAKVRLFTNGSRFTQENVDETLSLDPSRVTHIWISLNDVDGERYKDTMRYVAFEHVADRIDLLHRAWNRRIRHTIFLSRVSGLDRGVEEKRRQEFEAYCWKRWPGFRPFHIKRDAWIDYTYAGTDIVPSAPCGRWWELNIMATGAVALCCMDGKGEYSIGDTAKQTLLEIYNQPHLLLRRSQFANRHHISPCNRCTY